MTKVPYTEGGTFELRYEGKEDPDHGIPCECESCVEDVGHQEPVESVEC